MRKNVLSTTLPGCLFSWASTAGDEQKAISWRKSSFVGKSLVLFFLLVLFIGVIKTEAQIDGDYRSIATGNWTGASTWQVRSGGTWAPTSTAPTSANNVYIQSGHTVTMTADASCLNLFIAGIGFTDASTTLSSTGSGKVNVSTFNLQVYGTISIFTQGTLSTAGSPSTGTATTSTADGNIPGTTGTFTTSSTIYPITTGAATGASVGTGTVTFVGTADRALFVPNGWNINGTINANVIFNFSAGTICTLSANFRAANITVASGILSTSARIGCGNNNTSVPTNTGAFVINNGATFSSSATGVNTSGNQVISHSASSAAKSFTVQAGGTLQLSGAAPSIDAVTVSLLGTVVYNASGAQNLLRPSSVTYSPGGSSGAGTRDSTNTFIYNNITLAGTSAKTLIGGLTTTVNGTLSLQGTSSLSLGTGTLSYGSNAIVQYAGSAAQTTGAEWPVSSGPPNITIGNSNGVTTAASTALTISGTLNDSVGTFALGSSSSITYGASSTLKYTGTIASQTTGAEFPSSNGPKNLTINNTFSGGTVTLSAARTISGVLTLNSGVLVTTGTNLLSITNTATTAVATSGSFSATNCIRGPLARSLPVSLGSGSTYLYPLGISGSYTPFELVNPVTSSASNAVVQAQVVAGNTGGSGTALALNTNLYWSASATANAGSLTSTTIRLTDPNYSPATLIASSGTLAGSSYATVGSCTVNSTNKTITSPALSSFAQYLVMGAVSTVPQPSSFTATAASTTQLNLAASGSGFTGIVVYYNTTNSFTAPTPGNAPTTVLSGQTIAYSGAIGSLTNLTGLTANTKYYFSVYSYDGTNNYSSAPVTANGTTLSNAPVIGTASSISSNGFTANWTAPATQGSASFTYSIDTTIVNNNFGTGAGTISGISSSSLSQVLTSLSPQALYYYRIYAVNAGGNSAYASGSVYTLSTPVTSQGTGFAASQISTTSFVFTLGSLASYPAAATGAATKRGYLLVYSTGTPALVASPNGVIPSSAVSVGTPIITAEGTQGSTVPSVTGTTVTGLTNGNTYNALLVPYTWDGTNTATYNYLTTGALTTTITLYNSAARWGFASAGAPTITGNVTGNTLVGSPTYTGIGGTATTGFSYATISSGLSVCPSGDAASQTWIIDQASGSTVVNSTYDGISNATLSTNSTRYVQFNVSPVSGYNLTVNNLQFPITLSGTTSLMYYAIAYSRDGFVSDKNFLTANTTAGVNIPLGPISIAPSYNTPITVNNGQTLSVRLFFIRKSTVVSGSTYITIKNPVISGTTTAAPDPSILSFSPNSGGAGTSVTLTGTNFTGASSVTLNGVPVTSFTVNSATSITATVPSGVVNGGTFIVNTSSAVPAVSPTNFLINYYYKGSGSLTTVSNWGQNTAGNDGNTPSAGLTGTYCNFYIVNGPATVDANWTLDNTSNLYIGDGTTATAATVGSGVTLTSGTGSIVSLLANATLQITGTYIHASTTAPSIAGVLTIGSTGLFKNTAATIISSATTANFIVNGTYEHAVASTSANTSAIPTATWNTGSNCNVTGSTSSNSYPARTQTFYNFTWNPSAQTVSVSIPQVGFGVTNQLNVINTDATYVVLSSASVSALTVGKFVQTGGTVYISSVSSTEARIFNVGDFSISGSSVFAISNNSTYPGTMNSSGNLTFAGGTFRNNVTGFAYVNFTGTSQTYNSDGTTSFGTNALTYAINNGTTLNIATGNLSLTGTLTVASGGAINVASGATLTALNTITNSGGININGGTFVVGSGFSYIGSSAINYSGSTSLLSYTDATASRAYTAGNEWPSTNSPANVTINLSGTGTTSVTIGSSRTISGLLTLTKGNLIATNGVVVSNTATSAITGSSSSYIQGALTWSLPVSLASGSTYVFPIGQSTNYLPFSLVNPTTSSAATVTLQAFGASTGGNDDNSTLTSISGTEYWALISTGGFTNASASIFRSAALGSYNTMGYSATKTGTYTNLGGMVSGTSVINSNSFTGSKYFTFAQIYSAGAPSITSFTPTHGAVGTVITVTGRNFKDGSDNNLVTSISVSGVAITTYTVSSATSITATIPAGFSTSGVVSVVTGSGTANSSSQFSTNASTPTITSFTPTVGGSGTSVTITGTNFDDASTSIIVSAVTISGVPATSFVVNSSTSITVTVPNGVSTTGAIGVTTYAGTATSGSNFALNFYYRGAGNITAATSWGQSSSAYDGNNPGSVTQASSNFYITGVTSPSLDANWALASTSTLTIGDGLTASSLNVPASIILTTGLSTTVKASSTLSVGANGSIVNGTSSTLTLTGNLLVDGTYTYNNNAAPAISAAGKITIGSTAGSGLFVNNSTVALGTLSNNLIVNGQLTHNPNTTIPLGTWNTGSTIYIAGVTTTMPTHTQTFYNMVWDCSGQTAALTLPVSGFTLNGSLTVKNTGTGSLNLTNTSSSTPFTVINYTQTGGTVLITPASTNISKLSASGNVAISGGTFTLSASGTYSGTLAIGGDFSATGGTIAGGTSATLNIIQYTKAGTQVYTGGATFTGTISTNISAGSTLNIGSATYSITGAFTNNGSVTGSGIINLNGTAAQSITGTGSLPSLTLANSAGATISSGMQTITGVLSVNAGTFAAGDSMLTLKSTGILTSAILGPVLGTLTGTRITAERYIPKGYRSYRDIAPGVYRASNTIFNQWMENGSYTNNGYGMFITGGTPVAGTTGTGNSISTDGNGFDVSANAVKTAYTYASGGWTNIPNTGLSLNPFQGYRLLIRGDRSFKLYGTAIDNTSLGLLMYNATALRAKGQLITGKVAYSSSGVSNTASSAAVTAYNNATYGLTTANDSSFSLVGNPYICPVDWKIVSDSSANIENYYYYLDPTYGATGRYLAGNPATAPNYIQAGQAVFIKNKKGVLPANPSVVFTETSKAVGSTKSYVFGSGSLSKMVLTLLKQIGGGDTSYWKMDIATLAFDSSFSNSYDAIIDVPKLPSASDNLSIKQGGNSLSIYGRKPGTKDDTIGLLMSGLSKSSYQLQVDATNYNGGGLTAFVYDSYLKIATALQPAVNTIPFTADNAVAASYQDRFSIIFKPTILPISNIVLNTALKNDVVSVDWSTIGMAGLVSFDVEKSLTGTGFAKLATVAATASTAAYSFIDASVATGSNYYRIKALSATGEVAYSAVSVIKKGALAVSYSFYPNPVTNKMVNLQLGNVEKGVYTVSLYNSLGQKVSDKTVQHQGGTATYSIGLGKALASGVYTVSVHKSSGVTTYQASLSVE
ncbi:IPT/TIG domain-containing protein [Parasediminibacterium sp. JCM 36343]|uniref:IPT/TIG domain-containing protein n=1 Tax=Parasediminibacterium sp. JCM 36343 TaxID=3374279 RepID=UPI00397DD0E3